MSYNACVIKAGRAHKYWCSANPTEQEGCMYFVTDKQGGCVYNSAPNGSYGDWCFSFEAAHAAEDFQSIVDGGIDGR